MNRQASISKRDGLLSAEGVRFVAIISIGAAAAVLGVNFATYDVGRTSFGPNLGPDFGAYYMAGTLIGDGHAAELYDFSLQQDTYHHLFPNAPQGETGYYPCAPFFTLPFIPLAYLPYPWSYAFWSVISLTCYLASLRVLFSIAPVEDRLTLTLAAVSFFPYLMECLLGGQASAIGLLCFVLAIRAHLRHHSLRAGMWLAILCYKPTLLGLALLMLLVQRQWRVLGGFCLGAMALAFVSWLLVGTSGLEGFIDLLLTYAKLRREHPTAMTWFKYVDLANASASSLWRVVSVPIRLAALIPLVGVMLRLGGDTQSATPAPNHNGPPSENSELEGRRLSWALVLACTPVISPHCGVYDSVLVVAALLLAYVNMQSSSQWWMRFVATLYCAAWIGQISALAFGVNLYTLWLASTAVCLWWLAWNTTKEPSSFASESL